MCKGGVSVLWTENSREADYTWKRNKRTSRRRVAGSEALVSPDRREMDDASHFRAISSLPSRPPATVGPPRPWWNPTPQVEPNTLLAPQHKGAYAQGDRTPPRQPGSGLCAFVP